MKKKIVITGAAGEVGLNVLALLKENGRTKEHDIVAIDKSSQNLKLLQKLFPFAKGMRADLAEKGKWMEEFGEADAVIQLQAQISSPFKEPYVKNNIDSVRNVVDACQKYKVPHLIHASSSVVISVADDDYTRTKRAGEGIVAKSQVPYTIIRPTLLYGCFDIKHLNYLIRMFEKFPLFLMPGSGKYLRQPLFVEDFSNIIINLIETGPRKNVFNITGKEKIYLIDCLKEVYRQRKKKILFVRVPLPIFYMLIKTYCFFNRKSRIVPDQLTALTAGDIFPVISWDRLFDVAPTSYKDGVRKTVTSKYYDCDKKMIRLDR